MDPLRESDDLRLCLALLIGMSYADPKLRKEITTITPYRDRLPRDLVMLLEAVENRDKDAVETWLRDVRKLPLADDGKALLPVRLAGYLMRYHWKQVTHETIGGMARVVEMPVGEMLAGMKELVAKLEEAGIQPAEKT